MQHKKFRKAISLLLAASMTFSMLTMGVTAKEAEVSAQADYEIDLSYPTTITDEEYEAVHAAVDALVGDFGDDATLAELKLQPYTLLGGLAVGSDYDSISYGSRAAGSVPTEYPFDVPDTEANRNEGDRKAAKLAEVVELAKALGFETVVQRQDDKYVYVEIGDPDAPEMVMALSHLDSPTGSVSEAQLERWRDENGEYGTEGAYHSPYIQDGWLYGAGVQDDSGPTLATLFAAAALKNSGVEFDRRIRIVMGCYEDGSPGVPSKDNTLKYMDIPYYTGNPSFYDNWAYKSLNREETPIAGYTSDSRFPVVVGNSKATSPNLTMDLSADAGKPFSLLTAGGGITLRAGDDTLKDIAYGSAAQVPSRAVYTLSTADASADAVNDFVKAIEKAAKAVDWTVGTNVNADPTPNVVVAVAGNVLTLDINTGVAMEFPTPQYGKNALVWGMYLISEALGDDSDLKLKVAAKGIADLFIKDGVEGESYIGAYMGIDEALLRNPDSGVANLTIAPLGTIRTSKELVGFFSENTLKIPLAIRSMHTNEADYLKATQAVTDACTAAGFAIDAMAAFSNPTLYLSHDNILTKLQQSSYMAAIAADPDAFESMTDLLDITYPVGTTGGTLASNFYNKMTAYGAVIPGNERWWHTANERISVESIVQMTKLMADGMLEMARYDETAGSAGAQLMWADIEGYNSERAELDLLDITVGTYEDATEAALEAKADYETLLGATTFDIHMWNGRGNSSKTDAQVKLGHEKGGVYLPLDDEDFLANTFVLPMALEFKVDKTDDIDDADWDKMVAGDVSNINFYLSRNGKTIPLDLGKDDDASKFFSVRTVENDDDTIYVAANLAITDASYSGVSTVLADSKTDLYKLNAEYEAANGNPFPERGQIEERGFFLFGDGAKDACFSAPEAIFAALVPAEEQVELVIDYPADIPAADVTVDVYQGYPLSQWYGGTDVMVSQGWLRPVYPNDDGTYTLDSTGTYTYHISGEGYYNIMKIFNVTDDKSEDGVMTLTVEGGPLGGEGYEPTVKPELAPDSYVMDSRDSMLVFWPDEIFDEYFSVEPQNYQTPAFTTEKAAHELSSQEDMLAFVADRDAKCDYMYRYSAGKTPNYGFDIPMLIFTKTDLSGAETPEEAAELVNANGKVTVWYQSQIHPNEPASGEGSLVVIDNLVEDASLLDKINVVVIPRVNPDGAYLYSRATYGGFDMNRDHMALAAAELAQLHTAYRLFMAEVVVDTHEYDIFWGADAEGYMENADDLQTTPATSLNNYAPLNEVALDMCANTHKAVTDAGLRVFNYGATSNNAIGRAYFGINDALSFLIETRGIGAGRQNLERRVFTQETAVMAYLEYAAAHTEEIQTVVDAARADTLAKGPVYGEDGDDLILYQTISGNTVTDYTATRYQYHVSGDDALTKTYTEPEFLQDTIVRSRPRPTAYVIPADHENIETILYIMDNQGIEYYKLADGSYAELQQYYYKGSYVDPNGRTRGIEADLRDPEFVAFPNGAYVFPMDQAAADVLGLTMEPDVTDTNGYAGTLYQTGQFANYKGTALENLMLYDEQTKDFPIYRYTKDYPRETLVSNTAYASIVIPEGVEGASVELYKGFPTSASTTLENMIKNGQLTAMEKVGDTYKLDGPGVYAYHVYGEGIYNILKLVNITAEDLADGSVVIESVAAELGYTALDGVYGDGYQPTAKPSQAPDTYKMDARDNMLVIWPDEVLEHFTIADQEYETPAFDGTDAAHQVTTQEEMMAFLKDRDEDCDFLYQFSAGKTPNYGFDLPVMIFTKSADLSKAKTLEEAAELLNATGMTSVWYQTQIHPNEPASGEAALVVIDDFIQNNHDAQKMLDKINVIIVPRINPDGSYLFSRATYGGFDMNRDHMSLAADELSMLHKAYNLFMSEVVIDGHEFTFYGANTNGYMSNADDMQTTPATSLLNDPTVTKIALEMAGKTIETAEAEGLRLYHYGTTVNNPIGRAYFGLQGALSFLVETRGIGAGRTNFERRVFSQETAMLSYMKQTAERAEEIKEAVAAARADVVAKGAVYGEKDDILPLYQTKTGKTMTEYVATRVQYNLDGSVYKTSTAALSLNDTITRGRTRPTAYVIPADVKNIDRILHIMESQGIEYYELEPGSYAQLEQYYYVGTYSRSIEAGLREETRVFFDNGAYVFPMDQAAANVLAMSMEPDVTDSQGYAGTLYQVGEFYSNMPEMQMMDYDETTLNFPLYRYTKDDPRETLVDNAPSKPTYPDDGYAEPKPVEPPADDALSFKDVNKDDWFYNAVEYAYDNDLMAGLAADTFGPNVYTTRAMVVQMLYNLEGKPAAKAAEFDDVAANEWYAAAIGWAVEKGIASGYGEGKFGPMDVVTREQVAVMLKAYAALKGYKLNGTDDLADFTDADTVSAWALDAIKWAVGNKVMAGKGEGKLAPAVTATRAEIAAMFQNFNEAVK